MPQWMFEHLVYWGVIMLGCGMISVSVMIVSLAVLTITEIFSRR